MSGGLVQQLYFRLPGPARSVAATMQGLYLRWRRYGRAVICNVPEAEREAPRSKQWPVVSAHRISLTSNRGP